MSGKMIVERAAIAGGVGIRGAERCEPSMSPVGALDVPGFDR